MIRSTALSLLLLAGMAVPATAMEATLRGSPASMVRQNEVAKSNDFSFLRSGDQVRRFVDAGYLVPIESAGPLEVNRGVSYPFGRPEMKLFLERLAGQYMEACGERLVVTSLVRPTSEQPRNAHPLSVHPAGMAVDLRISSNAQCRSWLESTLLSLEQEEVLDVTREQSPPHYHIALFVDRYAEYAAPLIARDSALAAQEARERAARLALASLETIGNPLVATAAAEDPRPPADHSRDLALAIGLVVVGAALGLRHLSGRRGN